MISEPEVALKGGVGMELHAVGKRIKAAREAAGMTPEELSEILELTATHISVLERGVKSPKQETFLRITQE